MMDGSVNRTNLLAITAIAFRYPHSAMDSMIVGITRTRWIVRGADAGVCYIPIHIRNACISSQLYVLSTPVFEGSARCCAVGLNKTANEFTISNASNFYCKFVRYECISIILTSALLFVNYCYVTVQCDSDVWISASFHLPS